MKLQLQTANGSQQNAARLSTAILTNTSVIRQTTTTDALKIQTSRGNKYRLSNDKHTRPYELRLHAKRGETITWQKITQSSAKSKHSVTLASSNFVIVLVTLVLVFTLSSCSCILHHNCCDSQHDTCCVRIGRTIN